MAVKTSIRRFRLPWVSTSRKTHNIALSLHLTLVPKLWHTSCLLADKLKSAASLQWEGFGLNEHNVTTYKAAIWFTGLSPARYLDGP